MSLTIDELKTLDRLYQQGLDLPAEARLAWIDSLPPEHSTLAPILRAELLAGNTGAGIETADFLGTLPKLPVAAGMADGSGALIDEPAAGERVGPYQLVRRLGEGGMSSVWLAQRVDGTVKREVALKLPHRHLLDRGLAERMRRERDILAGLNHDHIARLYEAGVDDAGRPYLVLEYVVGAPINTFCEAQNVDLTGRIRLMIQVARAVAHAHANLVVHRDLKPNNILVTSGDTAPKVKLLDFGIAKLLARDDQLLAAPDLTQTLGRALTPDYASPEQLLEQPVTTASDIYSFGVVLYEVMTGEKPYKLKRQSASALADAVLHADVLRPSKRRAQGKHRSEAKRIEGDLDAIILKALKPAPAERYATASALADDLERFLAHQPVTAQPDSFAYRTRRLAQRHALAVSAGAVVALALIAGAGAALWQAQQARLETAKTKAVKDFLQSIINVGNVDQQDALLRRKQPIGDVLLDAAKSIPGRFADQPEVRAELQGLLGDALSGLSMNESARALHETRLAELTARGAPLSERMRAQTDLAATLVDTPEFKRGAQLLQEAISALATATDRSSRTVVAEASRELAIYKIERYDGNSGVDDAQRAVRIAGTIDAGSRLHVSALSTLGYAQSAQRDMPGAESSFVQALALAAKLPPAERAYEAQVRLRYAEALTNGHFHARALAQLNESLKIIEQTSGKDTFRWARTAVLAANLTAASGDVPHAKAMFEHVIRVYERFGDELDPTFLSTARAFLAQRLMEYGLFAEAKHQAELGYQPYRAQKNASPVSMWAPGTRYAHVLQALGDYPQSEKVMSDLLATMRAAKVADTGTAIPAGKRIQALNHLYRGHHVEAEALLNDAIATDAGTVGRFFNLRNIARIALARAYLDQGKLDDAETEIVTMTALLANIADDEIAFTRPVAAQLESLTGALRLKRGDAGAAAIHFQRAIDILLPRHHPHSPHLASARADLALAMAHQGNHAQAKALASQANAAFARHPAVGPHLRQSLVDVEKFLSRFSR